MAKQHHGPEEETSLMKAPSTIMMSPGLEHLVDFDTTDVPGAPLLLCRLSYDGGELEGALSSFVQTTDASCLERLDLSLELPASRLADALGCPQFKSVEIYVEGKTMISRPIDASWSQRREVLPHRTGLSLMLSTGRRILSGYED